MEICCGFGLGLKVDDEDDEDDGNATVAAGIGFLGWIFIEANRAIFCSMIFFVR